MLSIFLRVNRHIIDVHHRVKMCTKWERGKCPQFSSCCSKNFFKIKILEQVEDCEAQYERVSKCYINLPCITVINMSVFLNVI